MPVAVTPVFMLLNSRKNSSENKVDLNLCQLHGTVNCMYKVSSLSEDLSLLTLHITGKSSLSQKINMGKFHDAIKPAHKTFVEKQHIFFVASAPLSADGRVNLSPKGMDCFRVLSANEVGYMDLISSGNETSAHTLENGRITFMFCSFDDTPNILRLYGRGITVLPGTTEWEKYASRFTLYPSTRQLIIAHIDLVQTSCGFGVPMFNYTGERDIHFEWAQQKGADGLHEYVQQNNLKSLDGLPTAIGLQ